MPLKSATCFLSICLLITGCAVLTKPEVIKQPVLMPMAPPIGPSRRIVQQITAQWPNRNEILLCVLELDKQRIAMAGLTNDGVSLFNLTYDGKTIVSDKSPLLPDSLAPEFMITDLQLVYWPVAILQNSLRSSAWRLEVDPGHRRLYYRGTKAIEVNYIMPDVVWAKSVELINYRYNYRLRIRTIDYEALPE